MPQSNDSDLRRLADAAGVRYRDARRVTIDVACDPDATAERVGACRRRQDAAEQEWIAALAKAQSPRN